MLKRGGDSNPPWLTLVFVANISLSGPPAKYDEVLLYKFSSKSIIMQPLSLGIQILIDLKSHALLIVSKADERSIKRT